MACGKSQARCPLTSRFRRQPSAWARSSAYRYSASPLRPSRRQRSLTSRHNWCAACAPAALLGAGPATVDFAPQLVCRLRAGGHFGVVADDEGVARVAFVPVPHRPDVDEENIVRAEDVLCRDRLVEHLQRVAAETHERAMPDALHAH